MINHHSWIAMGYPAAKTKMNDRDKREKRQISFRRTLLIAFEVDSPWRWILIFVSFSIFFRSVLVKWRPWTSNSSDESFFLSANGKTHWKKLSVQITKSQSNRQQTRKTTGNLQRISPGISGSTRSSCQWSPLFLRSSPAPPLKNKLTLFLRLMDELVLRLSWRPWRIITFDSERLSVFVKSKRVKPSELDTGADSGDMLGRLGMSRELCVTFTFETLGGRGSVVLLYIFETGIDFESKNFFRTSRYGSHPIWRTSWRQVVAIQENNKKANQKRNPHSKFSFYRRQTGE